jgi:tetratricopeptide (TPR) repeat protein
MPTIDEIRALLAEEPDDAFLNFGLAMGLASAGRRDAALEQLDRTLAVDPSYVPAHFQKGRILADAGRTSEAREALEKGIAVARAAGDVHAAGEMRDLIELLG